MKRIACVASALAIMVLSAGADNEKLTVKELMGKLHKGAKAPLARLKTALKAETPNWKEVQDSSKELVMLGAGLPKTEPPKGDKASFEKLATSYYETAKALDTAAKSENKAETQAALGKIGASCKTCHSAHKAQ
jgi:cytochrome c556